MSDEGWHAAGWGVAIGTIAFLMVLMPGQLSRPAASEPTRAPLPASTRTTEDAPAATSTGAAAAPRRSTTSNAPAATRSGPAYRLGSSATGRLAASNLGKTAGHCAATPTTNSLGGRDFESSCPDGADGPENWAADFATWVWRQRGYNVDHLDATASSFASYADHHASLRAAPKPGDAVVFAEGRFAEPSHVGIVTRVLANGDVELANGNWGGSPSTDVAQARESKVERTVIPARQARVGGGAVAAQGDQQVVAIVAPAR